MSSSALAAGLRHLRRKLAAQQPNEDSDEQLLHAFTTRRDETAFAVLMRRHGPMVLHVCRCVLGHEQDAEDAFQATFLVLARNAAALRRKTTLASFLHGIAYRTAMKAKQAAARRRKHQNGLGALTQPRSPVDPADELSWREMRMMLDEEIARLPEIYRSVFVLCNLEDLSREEAARRLGLKVGTVSSLLTTARKRLTQRLARRGVELTAVPAATTLAAQPASALPPLLTATTIEAALATAAGEGLSGVVSASIAELVKGTTAAMVMSKAKVATVVLLAAMLLSGAGLGWSGGFRLPSGEHQSPETSATQGADTFRSAKREATKTEQIQGRIVGPDGKPKAGAKLLLLGKSDKLRQLGTTAADGRFAISVPKNARDSYLIAQSEGCGIDFVNFPKIDPKKPVELRLVKDRPIHGRVVNTEGRPAPGVRVAVDNLGVYPNNSLDSFLAIWKKQQKVTSGLPNGEKHIWEGASALLAATTDAEGRFTISQVGEERLVSLRLSGGGIAGAEAWVVNRRGFDPNPYNEAVLNNSEPSAIKDFGIRWHLYGPGASFVVETGKTIRGIVKEPTAARAAQESASA
ncbi:MAG TPA: sigma-70 family RNA polymerase sigma factor [Gemmataceae bacterium]|nr:sigma-70 family RNA polymerase sigma factor [Gemmataceae bacterium]